MNDWRNKLINFMVGRYGMDNLNKFIWWSGIALWLFGFILGIGVLSKLALAFFIIYVYRMLSKNYNQRYNENQLYLKHTEKFRHRLSELKKKHEYKKTHKIYKCPKCKKSLSVPKGKGKIEISCPCGHKFRKKT